LAHAILMEMGIPCYVMFDGDKGYEGRARSQGKKPQVIRDTVQNHRMENLRLLEYLGADEEDFPDTATHARYAVIEDTLEPLLEAEWQGWMDETRRIIDSGLGTEKKNSLVYLIAAKQISSPAPQLLQDVLRKVHLLVS
ncbi:MAG TPA: hypothetical protein VNO31_05035, partial [Umezawaea sp.]|nr:hypothetical protein [Umezawaea sp.]